MKGVAIYPYKAGSASARNLSQAMGVKRIKHEGSKFVPNGDKIVINWGASELPMALDGPPTAPRILNMPQFVRVASNKLHFYDLMNQGLVASCRMPISFRTKQEADLYRREANSCAMMARTVLTGHSGRGIIYCEPEQELPDAQMYVRYVKKISEFRLHFVASNDTPFIQRKARRNDVDKEDVNWKVRNLEGGFIYANDPENVGEIPEDVIVQGTRAFKQSRLGFGAVDVIFNKKEGKAYVLEINTAPGLVNSTVEWYAKELTRYVELIRKHQ